MQPRARLAHQAAHWARGQGRFEDYNAAVFRAFFERGEDIGDIRILTGLAADLGLEGDVLRQAIERREFEQSVLEDERTAEALGLRGVPAFVANREALLSGVQPVDSLKRLIEQVRA